MPIPAIPFSRISSQRRFLFMGVSCFESLSPSTSLNSTTEEVVTYDQFDAEVNRTIAECRKENYLRI